MAFSQFPAPAAGAESAAFAATLAVPTRVDKHVQDFSPGVYSITVAPSPTEARLTFVNATSVIATVTTSTQLAVFALTTAATQVYIQTLQGGTADATVSIEKTADPLTSTSIGSGTLDTINTTGTYNQTGLLGVLVISGGDYGRNGNTNNPSSIGGAGGRAGYINGGMVYTNTAETITVGAGGIGSLTTPTAPTNSSFGNLITATTASNIYPNGNGGAGAYYSNPVGNASGTFSAFTATPNDTTGGGRGKGRTNANGAQAGAGSGIGTGGSCSGVVNDGIGATSGTGKGSGGGGGGSGNDPVQKLGGDGAPGVVYVLRGF